MIDRLAELCDRVAELEAENARLAQKRRRDTSAGLRSLLADAEARVERLEAANAQLRAALASLATYNRVMPEDIERGRRVLAAAVPPTQTGPNIDWPSNDWYLFGPGAPKEEP